MARPRATASMTISQLENLLSSQRGQLNKLTRARRRAQLKVDRIDKQIAQLDGGANPAAGGGTRIRNSASLVQTLERVLRRAGKPMRVGDIVDAVVKTGYRSRSANFRSIVNQTLIKEKQFASAGRGLYQTKS